MAIWIKRAIFSDHPNILREHFRSAPGTLLRHPFAGRLKIPGVFIMYMMIIDKDIEDITEEDKQTGGVVKQATDEIMNRVRNLDNDTLRGTLCDAIIIGQVLSNPMELESDEENFENV